jgi:hypothetical protein
VIFMVNRATSIANEARIEGFYMKHLLPREKVRLARTLLNSIKSEDFDYAEFVGAKAVERNVKKARKALEGLPL